jgi:hypothetical protein
MGMIRFFELWFHRTRNPFPHTKYRINSHTTELLHTMWQRRAIVLPIPCCDHSSTVIRNNEILIIGGSTSNDPSVTGDTSLKTVILFDVLNNVISPRKELNYSISQHKAIHTGDGWVTITGGRCGIQHLRETNSQLVTQFFVDEDPYNYYWNDSALVIGRAGHTTVNYYDSIFSFGGCGVGPTMESTFLADDGDINSRTIIEHSRHRELETVFGSAEVFEDRIYIFGGRTGYRNMSPNDRVIMIYPDEENETVVVSEDSANIRLPFPLCNSASVAIGKWIILIGGLLTYVTPFEGTTEIVTNKCFLYNVVDNKWYESPVQANLRQARYRHTASMLDNGLIVVTGGLQLRTDRNDGNNLYNCLNSIESIHYTSLFPDEDDINISVLKETDDNGELPIHRAARHNLKWEDGMEMLVESYPASVIMTGFHYGDLPVVLASSHGDDSCLTTVYVMLRITISSSIELNST